MPRTKVTRKPTIYKHGQDTGLRPIRHIVLEQVDSILARYSQGESWHEIARSLTERPITGVQLKTAVVGDPNCRAKLDAVNAWRAQYHFERAADMARALEADDPKAAADVHLKVAAKLDPQRYGDKSTISVIATRAPEELSDEDLARIAQQSGDVIDLEESK